MNRLYRNRLLWVWISLIGAFWLPSLRAQQVYEDCDDFGLQKVLISNQAQIPIDQGPGFGFVCYDPVHNCFIAAGNFPLYETIAFSAQQGPLGLNINSLSSCGGVQNSRANDRPFSAVLSGPTLGAGACMNKLHFRSGPFTGGQLVNTLQGPAVLLEGSFSPILLDPFIASSLTIPLIHNGGNHSIALPMTNNLITVRIQNGPALGTVSAACGATLAGAISPPSGSITPPQPVPTMTFWGLLLLCGVILAAAVWAGRRHFSV